MATHRWGKFEKTVDYLEKFVGCFKIENVQFRHEYSSIYRIFIEDGKYQTYTISPDQYYVKVKEHNLSTPYLIADNIFSSNTLCTSPSDFNSIMIQSPGRYSYTVYKSSADDEPDVTSVDIRELGDTEEFKKYSKGSRLGTVTSTNRNAYPNNGQSGSYWYVYEGIANQTPTISGKDEDLGGFKAPFKKVFSVNDPDNNETLNVTVKLNSATIRTINNATKGESYEIDIDKAKFDELELNKTNTIEITVSDSNGASAIRRYTFKKVNTNPVVTVTNSNLGEQNKPFNFSFKAADPDLSLIHI